MLKELFRSKKAPYAHDVINILRLIRSENIGPRTFLELLKIFGSVEVALENIAAFSVRGGLSKPVKIYSQNEVERELELLSKYNAHLISYRDPLYSSLLLQIFDFPPILTYKGNIELLNYPKAIAIVGSRAASINGKNFATSIAKDLIEKDYITVSGLARGIDTAVHNANPAKTIAVVAGGIDNIYPLENRKIYEQIAEEGLLISELPIGTQPLAQHFPRRNRLISGLTLATLVIEANLNSGSLITAKFAVEHNRDVFAVPGFPGDPRYQGNNQLIKDGAYVLESAHDVIANINNYKSAQKSFEFEEENKHGKNFTVAANLYNYAITDYMRNIVINLLSTNEVDIEDLVTETKLPIQILQMVLLEFELAGKVIRIPGNKVIRVF